MNDLEFKIAYEITLAEFCDICKKNGLTPEQTKAAIIENVLEIADRIKQILPAQ